MAEEKNATATFAGGCFWCMQQPFEQAFGVLQAIVGYTGGTGVNPTYSDYVQKGFTEGIQISYNPAQISYKKLVDIFLQQIDPTDAGGQFYDRGPGYKPAIFYHNTEQKEAAQKSLEELRNSRKFTKAIAVEIIKYTNFYPAEQYHQQYYKKNPEQYTTYKNNSGREQFLKKYWPESNLTSLEHDVIKCSGTEPPFNNLYWDNKKPGIYVDKISGEPLFSSLDKFDSGTGWPSFSKPLEIKNIVTRQDTKLAQVRTEVRSAHADSHLGHVFGDGPKPGGLRYCINSAALRFIPLEDLEKEGYSAYNILFKNKSDNNS